MGHELDTLIQLLDTFQHSRKGPVGPVGPSVRWTGDV